MDDKERTTGPTAADRLSMDEQTWFELHMSANGSARNFNDLRGQLVKAALQGQTADQEKHSLHVSSRTWTKPIRPGTRRASWPPLLPAGTWRIAIPGLPKNQRRRRSRTCVPTLRNTARQCARGWRLQTYRAKAAGLVSSSSSGRRSGRAGRAGGYQDLRRRLREWRGATYSQRASIV